MISFKKIFVKINESKSIDNEGNLLKTQRISSCEIVYFLKYRRKDVVNADIKKRVMVRHH